jgi:predicted nucleotidyltransferase
VANETFRLPENCKILVTGYRGSIAHGLYVPSSDPKSIDDIDIMGFVVAPVENYLGLTEWGSRGTCEYWDGQYDCVFYELRKAVSLLLQGNPNILSMLWLRPEDYLQVTPAWEPGSVRRPARL